MANLKNSIIIAVVCGLFAFLHFSDAMANILWFGGSFWLPFLSMVIVYAFLSGSVIQRVILSSVPCVALSGFYYFIFVVPSQTSNDVLSQAFFQVLVGSTFISGVVLVFWGYTMGASKNANK